MNQIYGEGSWKFNVYKKEKKITSKS